MPDKSWHRAFDDPIPLPNGRELRILRDAGNFISKLPKAKHDSPEWHAAIEALMLVAEHGGDPASRLTVLQGPAYTELALKASTAPRINKSVSDHSPSPLNSLDD